MANNTKPAIDPQAIKRLKELAQKLQRAGFDLRVTPKKKVGGNKVLKKSTKSIRADDKERDAKIAGIKKKLRQELS